MPRARCDCLHLLCSRSSNRYPALLPQHRLQSRHQRWRLGLSPASRSHSGVVRQLSTSSASVRLSSAAMPFQPATVPAQATAAAAESSRNTEAATALHQTTLGEASADSTLAGGQLPLSRGSLSALDPSTGGKPVYDVIVAGGGPVGLFLACELRHANLAVLVLEQAADPHSPLKQLPFGIRGLWGPSVEAFYRRGLLEPIASQPHLKKPSNKAPGPPRPGSIGPDAPAKGPAGHFAGITIDYADIDMARLSHQRLPSPADTQLAGEMAHIERVLTERALSAGVEIVRGRGVDGFEQSSDEVAVRAGADVFRARWLVGCDGGRSTVRKQAGFEFTGTEPAFTGYSVYATIADPDKLRMGRHYTATGVYTQWQPGVLGIVDFDGGIVHRSQPLTREHVQEVLRRVSGTDVTLTEMSLASTWTDRAKQVSTYRTGRVLLAGDAAHIHSPLGGQGLNLGLGDALNLGWKLAATVRGQAPDGLLDTYSTERHPIGARILDWTRAQVSLMRPNPHARALEAIVRDLIRTRDGATYFADRLWGLSLRYDPTGLAGLDRAGGGGGGGAVHRLVGCSCPDFELVEGGGRVGVLLRAGGGLLLDFDGRAGLRALDGLWGEQVRYVGGDVKDRLGISALLVRPDGFVAWASDDAAADPEDVRRAAAQWFTSREQVDGNS